MAHSRASKRSERTKSKGLGWGWILIGIVLIIVVWGVYSISQPSPTPTQTNTGGAPDFNLPIVGPNGLTGQKVSLSSFRGKVVLLEFMVPQCSHCQNMAPVLEKLYQQYGSSNVVLLSVSGSWNGATAKDAASFIQNYHSSWTYVYDSSGMVFNTYGVTGTPTFFLIDKNGQIVKTYPGETSYETLAADITRINS